VRIGNNKKKVCQSVFKNSNEILSYDICASIKLLNVWKYLRSIFISNIIKHLGTEGSTLVQRQTNTLNFST